MSIGTVISLICFMVVGLPLIFMMIMAFLELSEEKKHQKNRK